MDIDWNLVHDAGCTFDDSELPHHVSSKQEIQTLLASTEKLIGKPTVIENVLSKINSKKTIFYRGFFYDECWTKAIFTVPQKLCYSKQTSNGNVSL